MRFSESAFGGNPSTLSQDPGSGSRLAGAPGFLRTWRERRIARHTCRELMQRYHAVAARQPGLQGLPLYRQVLAEHLGDAKMADAVMARAGESYAQWPAERALRFRDLVHFLAAAAILDLDPDGRGVRSDIRRTIDTAIPSRF